MVVSKNMKEFSQKTSVIDIGEQDKYHKCFHTSTGRYNTASYTGDICRENSDAHVNIFCRRMHLVNTYYVLQAKFFMLKKVHIYCNKYI